MYDVLIGNMDTELLNITKVQYLSITSIKGLHQEGAYTYSGISPVPNVYTSPFVVC